MRRKITKRAKRSKFHNVRTEVNGIVFASKKEAARWEFLLEQQARGIICDLRRQTRWPLLVNKIKIGAYVDDFNYTVVQNNTFAVEDVKSPRTCKLPMYRRSKKHMLAQYSINVREVFDPYEPV